MKHIKSFEIYNLNENWLTNILSGGGDDGDLGNQILEYLENYNRTYKSNSRYRPTDITRGSTGSGDESNRFHFISDNIFFKEVEVTNRQTKKKEKKKKSTGKYRIDVAMVSDEKSGLHKDPYQVFISKVENNNLNMSRGGDVGILKDYDPQGWRGRSGRPSGNIKTSKSEGMHKLSISKTLAKKIYKEAEEIWFQTNRNVKSTARGGRARRWRWTP
jgi:hypothetical protein